LELLKAILELLKDPEKGKNAVNILFGTSISPRLLTTLRWSVWFLLVLSFAAVFLKIIAEIQQQWRDTFQRFFVSAERRHFLLNRQRFAKFLAAQLDKLNLDESWEDYRFAELEAEVEAEGRRHSRWIQRLRLTRRSIRRERSLSEALERTDERLILLEGDPGSGKSVALRHVADHLAHNAARTWNDRTPIPLYLNLKNIRRNPGQEIDQELIRAFALAQLTKVNNRDVERFVEEHFENGIRNGSWFLLFDSFDEIPEVLSSTDDDNIVAAYSDALYDFFTTFNTCKGVIASRYFRSPRQGRLPRFRILPLSEERRQQLIRRAGLAPQIQQEVFRQLGAAAVSIRQMAANPMFLGLLCEFVRDGRGFPDASHAVFERYVERRLTRDALKLAERFHVTPDQARVAAESAAYSMSADARIGLAATRADLLRALEHLTLPVPERFDELLSALEYIKLGRAEEAGPHSIDRRFTFAHRRFQEYFSTSVVLRNSERVKPRNLLTEPRWRETAVVLLQTQPLDALVPLLTEATCELEALKAELPISMLGPSKKPEIKKEGATSFRETVADASALADFMILRRRREPPRRDNSVLIDNYPWPTNCLHILGILQDGLAGRPEAIPLALKNAATALACGGFYNGRLADKKLAIEVAGAIPSANLLQLVEDSFAIGSQWLGEAAYSQITRLDNIPRVAQTWILRSILQLAIQGRLRNQWQETKAFLLRLPRPRPLLDSARLLLFVPVVDAVLLLIACGIGDFTFPREVDAHRVYLITAAALLMVSTQTSYRCAKLSPYPVSDKPQVFFATLVTFRVLIVSGACIFLHLRPVPSLKGLTVMAIILYALAWCPVAAGLAQFGKATPVISWFLIQIPTQLITSPARTIRLLRAILHATIFSCCVFPLYIIKMAKHLKQPGVFAKLLSILAVIAGFVAMLAASTTILFVVLSVCGIGIAFECGRILRHDLQILGNVRHSNALLPMDALNAWGMLRSNRLRIWLIQHVAQRSLLLPHETSEDTLRALVVILEHDLRRGPTFYSAPCGNAEVDSWYTEHVRRRGRGISHWGMGALDELCRLEQNLTESRRGRSPGVFRKPAIG
jgi:hypothetical protein